MIDECEVTEPVIAEWGGRVYPAKYSPKTGIVTIAPGALPKPEDANGPV